LKALTDGASTVVLDKLFKRLITRDEKKCSLISVRQWGLDGFILWPRVRLSASNLKNTESGKSVNPCIILNSSMKSAA